MPADDFSPLVVLFPGPSALAKRPFRGACPSKRLYRLAAIQPAAQTNSPKGCRHPGRRLPTEPLFPSRPSRPHGRPIRRRPSPTVIFAPAKAKQGSNRARPLVAGDPSTICPLSFGPQAPAPSHLGAFVRRWTCATRGLPRLTTHQSFPPTAPWLHPPGSSNTTPPTT